MSRRARRRSLAMELKRAEAYREPDGEQDHDDDVEVWLEPDDPRDTSYHETTHATSHA